MGLKPIGHGRSVSDGLTPPSETPVPDVEKKYGVNLDMTCDEYVARNWRLGASIEEIAPGPMLTQIKFTTTITAVAGTKVTIKAEIDAPGNSNDSVDDTTFDACTQDFRTAIPSNIETCPITSLGFEIVKVEGRSYKAEKLTMGVCNTNNGKTFSSTVWRVNELPLWGIIKRDVSGTVFPDSVGNKLSPVSKKWNMLL